MEQPISPEPTAMAAPTLTTADVISDALNEGTTEEIFGAFSNNAPDLLSATQASTAAFARNNTMFQNNISLEQLFGKAYNTILSAEGRAAPVCDPLLLDTERMIHETFGYHTSFVHEAFTVENAYARLQRAIADASLEDCMSEFDTYFGPNAEFVKKESGVSIRPNVTMSAAHPTKRSTVAVKPEATPEAKAAALINSTLLMTMPTVYPNRQILHFDAVPYNPMTSRPKESTDRKTFTPQNIMMWTYEPKTKQFLSNTRIIQWSDGTTTLHVGAESYDVETFTDGALSFLGERRHMYRCDKAYSAIVETVPIDNHVTVRSRSDKQNSIDIITASRNAKAVAENVALSIGLPISGLPAFVGEKGSGRKSVEEEYVESERAALRKLMAEMERNGTPMSLAEQMRRDAQILSDVISIGKGIESLVAKASERKRLDQEEKEAAKAQRDANKLGTKRVRIPNLDGSEKKSRPERKTDREVPAAVDEEVTALAEKIVREELMGEDLGEANWRLVLTSKLDAIRDEAFDEEVKNAVDDTKEAILNLSKRGAAAEVRKFLTEAAEDSTLDASLNAMEVILTRLENE